MLTKIRSFISLSATLWLIPSMATLALACTRVLWTPENGDVYVGRTQDWRERINTTFHKFPRGEERTGLVDENPLKWTSRYGSLSLLGYDLGPEEGVNEAGLSAHLLFLATETDYGRRDKDIPAISILQWAQYFLDNYATVEEALEGMKQKPFQIVPLVFPNGEKSTLHLSLQDKSGDSAIVEWVDGKPKIWHGKEYKVMTNEPTYDKQLANLKNYRTFGGDKPLPGERLPMDRFVRASYYSRALPTPESKDMGAAYIMSVMRNVSVPYGAAEPGRPNVSNTIYRSVIDMTSERYFFESTFAPNIVWIDYGKLDFSPQSGESQLRVEKEIMSLSANVTNQLKPVANFTWKKDQ